MRISDWSSDVCSSDLQVDIPQMRVPVQQGVRQCLLMAMQLRHTLTQLIAGSAQALYHFALEVLVIDLMLDREGNLFVHEARKRSFDMRFEEWDRKSTRLNSSH